MKEQMQNVNIQGADEDIIEFVKSYYAYESEKKETHQETKISSVNLTPELQKRLADKLTMLPHEARCVLFGQYCFHMTFFDIHETYGINKPEEVSDWYKRVLAKLAGLNGKQRISEESFAKICDEAMARYIKKKENDSDSHRSSDVIPVFCPLSAAIPKISAAASAQKIISWMVFV